MSPLGVVAACTGVLSLAFFAACSGTEVPGGTAQGGSPGALQAGAMNQGQAGTAAPQGSSGSAPTPGGGAPGAGGNGPAGSAASAGANEAAGSNTSGASNAGGAGNTGGAGNAGGMSMASAGFEPGDTPPDRPIKITTNAMEHTHGQAGMDARAKPLGKLVVDIGVSSGGYVRFLAKRGYHSIGAPCGSCPAPNLDAGREAVGQCRLQEFANTEAKVKATLTDLAAKFPEEDWGYFLMKDGNVRWSDVAITGMSHGATTAAVAGRVAQRVWRVVSRSGPRDDTCGNAGGVCQLPLSTPSYDEACKPEKVAAWLDAPSKTPINRFYGLVGTKDVECGDIMFNMHYARYPGAPVIWNEPGAVLTGTNQFVSTEGGHLDFLSAANLPLHTEEVLDIAFGIPEENRHPAF